MTDEAPLPGDLGEVYEENKEKVDREVLEELAKGEAEKTEATNESEPIQSGGTGETPSDPQGPAGGAEEPIRVAVLISLTPPALISSEASLNEVQEATARVQREVLDALNTEDFLLKYQYENFPALAGSLTREGLDALLSNPQVTYIEANRILELHLGESVHLIGADQVQNNLGVTGEGVTVGIIDTGIDYNHPDLGGCLGPACKVQGGRDFVDGDNNPMDGHGHGTHVAGIVAANGTVRGVAPDARLVALRVCTAGGCPTDRMIAAIDWARTHQSAFNIRALNMSIGGSVAYNSACNGVSPLMTTAIRNARQSGIVTFVSSGNNGFSNGISFPACVNDAVSVGAVYDANLGSVIWGTAACTDAATVADLVACGSNSGAILDLLAPGSYIRSTQWGGGHVNWQGTSMASPHAAGTAALLLEAVVPDGGGDIEIDIPFVDPFDFDGDSFKDDIDACPLDPGGHIDTDGDGVCDPGDPDDDGDGDSVADGGDCAPLQMSAHTNVTQYRDYDQDGVRENSSAVAACTDGSAEFRFTLNATGADNCPTVSSSNQADADGDGDGDACDADLDWDGDGLNNAQEAALGTDANKTDTDSDGVSDPDEVAQGRNPAVNEAALIMLIQTLLLDD